MTWDQNTHSAVTTLDAAGVDTRQMTYLEAIQDALGYEMARDSAVLLMGEDIGVYGGAFKVTQGLIEEFGADRVIDTPMAELSMIGAAIGMSFVGFRPVIEMQFADFITTGFDSVVQYAATNHYRWGAPVPITIRAPSGGGLRGGPFHSQNPEAWFVHTPGLKVVAPATPADAYGLLLSAIRDNNPVLYFESKYLYRSLRGPVLEGEHGVVPIGVARVAREGSDLSIISYGPTVQEALRAAEELAGEGYEVEVIDLRSLKPLDTDTVLASVRKTSKALIAHEANQMGGFGGEIAALISQHAFEDLDGPVMRVGGADVPVPYSPPLEDAYRVGRAKIVAAARELLEY